MDQDSTDISDIVIPFKDIIMEHWSFVLVAVVLGLVGNFAKTRVWTKERAMNGKPQWLWWWGRASLPLHAPVSGILTGLLLILIFGDNAPAGPGVDSAGEVCLYYMGSGVLSLWTYNIIKNFMKVRGIKTEYVQMPNESVPESE